MFVNKSSYQTEIGIKFRDPDLFWTSGQWMTEMRGGSDVGQATDTIAVPQQVE